MTERQRCLGVSTSSMVSLLHVLFGVKISLCIPYLYYDRHNTDGTGFVHVSDAGRAGTKYIFKRNYV